MLKNYKEKEVKFPGIHYDKSTKKTEVKVYQTEAINIVAERFITGINTKKLSNSPISNRINTSSTGKKSNQINESIQNKDELCGIFDKFNHLAYHLVSESYDWLSDSIYSKIIYSLTSGNLTDEVSQPNKSKKDYSISKIDFKKKMLYTSVAKLLNGLTTTDPKKKRVVHDFEKIIDTVKEKLRIVIPYVSHMYRDLIKEASLY